MSDKNKNIIIGVLSFLVLILAMLSCYLLFSKNNFTFKESVLVKYKEYDDDLINIDSDDYEVKANILNYNNLAILVKGDEEKTSLVDITVEYKDEEGKEVNKEEYTTGIYKNGYSSFILPLPDLDGKYAGYINIKVKDNKGSYESEVDMSSLNITNEKVVDGDNNTNINITVNNNSGKVINDFLAAVVVLKDDKIVYSNSFNLNNLAGNANTTITIPAEINKDGETKPFDYDDLLIFPVYAN